MKSIEAGTAEIVYNEANNEIRVLLNAYESNAQLVTFSSTKNNLENFLAKLEAPETHKIIVTAQPMVIQTVHSNEDSVWLNYRLDDADLSANFKGEQHTVAILLDPEVRSMLQSEIWALGEILDYVIGL